MILRGNITVNYSSDLKFTILQFGRHNHFGEFSLIGLPAYFDFQARTPLICLYVPATTELKQNLESKMVGIKYNILQRLETLLLLKYQGIAEARGARFDFSTSRPKILQSLTTNTTNQRLDTSYDDIGPLFAGENFGRKILDLPMLSETEDTFFPGSFSKMRLLADPNKLESEHLPEYHIPSEPHDLSINMASYLPKKEVRLSPARRFPDPVPNRLLKVVSEGQLEPNSRSEGTNREKPNQEKNSGNFLELLKHPEIEPTKADREFSLAGPEAQLLPADLGDLAAGIDKTKNLVVSQLPDESFEVFRLEHFGVDDQSQTANSDFKLNALSDGVDSGFLKLLSKKHQQATLGVGLLGLAKNKPALPPITAEQREALEYPEHKRDFEVDDHNLLNSLRVSSGSVTSSSMQKVVAALEVILL